MTRLFILAAIASPTFAAAATGQDREQHHAEHAVHAEPAAKPVNAMCPIGKEPIVPSAGTIEYKGRTLGFCCPGCSEQFMAWEEPRRDAFVQAALRGEEPGHGAHAQMDKTEQAAGAQGESGEMAEWADPYTLDTCPVSGMKLGSMGDPVARVYGGREVRFCCDSCLPKFEADTAGYFAKIDEKIVEDQLRYYPVERCVVSGEAMDAHGASKNFVYGNRLVRTCCAMCEKMLAADPGKYIEKLDEAAAEAQRADYPLDTCVVSGMKLSSMGEPTEAVFAGRLVRFCCGGCEPKVEANPAEYLEKIDQAWRSHGRFISRGGGAARSKD